MGIVGAGNSGSLMATLFAPRLAERIGWANTFGLAMMPVVWRRDPVRAARQGQPGEARAPGWSDYAAVLREPDTLWFSFLYSLTFGGFVGFTSFLTTFFHEQYHAVAGERRRLHDDRRRVREACCGRSADGCRIGSAATVCCSCCSLCAGVRASAPSPSLPPLAVVVPMLLRDGRAASAWATARSSARAAALCGAHGHRDRHASAPPEVSAGSSCRPCWAPRRTRPAPTRSV